MKNNFKFLVAAFAIVALSVTTASAAYTHTVTLKYGMRSAQVTALQQTLNTSSWPVDGGLATGYFGSITKGAVVAFQNAHPETGLADGIVGPKTGAVIASMGWLSGNFPAGCTSAAGFSATTGLPCTSTNANVFPAGCTSAAGYSPTTGVKCTAAASTPSTSALSGTVGDLAYALTSGINNEEVGEDENDVKVAGLELDAEDSESDVQVTAVKINFDRVSAATATDFEDVADEVSIWLGSTKVGSADASDFNDDNSETKTIALSDAIVRMNSTEDLFVKVSGASNIDSTDFTDTWTVDFTSVRFVDAQGAVVSEDPGTGTRTFSFESFATANNAELKVALNTSEDAVNDAHVINVDATDDTNDVSILAFTLKASGDSDVKVKSVPVLLTVATASNVDDMITSVDLYHGTTKIDSQNITATTGTTELVTFTDLNLTIDAGDTEQFLVKANFISIADALNAGDTIKAELTGTEVDLIDAEDESGENLAAGDLIGTATGSFSEVRDIGINAVFASASSSITHTGDIVGSGTGDDDQGTFKITFDVTAFDGDVYIDGTSPALTGGGTATDIDIAATAGTPVLLSSTITSSTGATMTGTVNADARFKVADGETERFTITAIVSPSTTADATVSVSIANILYALTDVDGDLLYTFNLTDFKTADLYLNAN